MFVDASVVVAILGREPGYEEILNRLSIEAGPFHISPLVRFEATVSLARKKAGMIGGKTRASVGLTPSNRSESAASSFRSKGIALIKHGLNVFSYRGLSGDP